MRLLLLMISILLPVFGQELRPRPRPVQPVRVMVKAPDDETNAEMAEAVKAALRSLPGRDIAITEKNGDVELLLNAIRLSGGCNGYAVAIVIASRQDRTGGLRAYSGPTVADVAKHIVADLDRERFEPLRAGAGR
jgi:hypothetical protein